MGNALAARNKSAKVMKVDGATFKVKPPARAIKVLRNHPGHDLLDSEEVKRLGVRARPLGPDAPLRPGKLYFLVELPRRAWSGKLQVAGAKERLENLRISRRSMSDLSSLASRLGDGEADHETAAKEAGGAVRVRVRLRLLKVELEKLMRDSRDAAEAAEKIKKLCVEKDGAAPPPKALRRTISAVTIDQSKEPHKYVELAHPINLRQYDTSAAPSPGSFCTTSADTPAARCSASPRTSSRTTAARVLVVCAEVSTISFRAPSVANHDDLVGQALCQLS